MVPGINTGDSLKNSARNEEVLRLPPSKFNQREDHGFIGQNLPISSTQMSMNRYRRVNNPKNDQRAISITPKLNLPGTAGNVGIGSLGSPHNLHGKHDTFS